VLTLKVVMSEEFDDDKNEFVTSEFALELEHSLVSLSKWESFFEKPFLSEEEKTPEEIIWYVQAMCLDLDVPAETFARLTKEHFDAVQRYIDSKQTATWFNEVPGGSGQFNREIITAEIVYYWMVEFRIPFECQHWHFNRLLTLVKVCNEKKKPPRKMSRRDMIDQRRALNAKRLQEQASRGQS
jgi:hypothetical protein